MKVRADFVTNSSSCGFIVGVDKNQLEEFQSYLKELAEHEEAQNEGVRTYMCIDNQKDLDDYTNQGPFDWASEPRGLQFIRLAESQYETCKEAIEAGKVIMEVWIDYGVCEDFDDAYGNTVLEDLS